ncbi:hypothetical protein ACH9L7_06385 [Haloferax sp. S1W]|uniref:hypothetical protein n=1 Tax=Haloferax sp. S1W TaxID=3377110 RepID=UPI0037C8E1AB
MAPQPTREEVKRILRTGAAKWAEVSGRGWKEFAREFVVDAEAYDTPMPMRFRFGDLRTLIG